MNLFDQMMSSYEIRTNSDYNRALQEVMQKITLAGLYRAGFFSKAAFYGGTCLRLFHHTDRYSEDMDFSLLVPDEGFTLEPLFPFIVREFNLVGRTVEITRKNKTRKSAIESAFLKDESPSWSLTFRSEKKVKVKIEVDTMPPGGFNTSQELMLMPFSFFARCYSLPDLFAGKMHAMLFRNWKSRIKGRDWYDFEWYVRNGVRMNLSHFVTRSIQSEHLKERIGEQQFLEMLQEKIRKSSISQVLADILPFVPDKAPLEIWSTDYFLALARNLRFLS
jgi:predicted nucleotidyltransferase component of viral defense system